MNIRKFRIFADDGGAVTVDWVVLCAAVVALAGMAASQLTGNAEFVGEIISNSIAD